MNRRLILALFYLGACSASPSHAAGPEGVAYVSNQGGGVTLLNIQTLKPEANIVAGASPRGIAVSKDGRWLLTANQGSADVSVIDTATKKEVRRIPVGANAEFIRIAPGGDRAFVTYEPSSTGGPPSKEASKLDDDATPAEVAVIDLQSWKVIGRMKASLETEGIEFSQDGKQIIVTNEGDNSLTVYDSATLKQTQRIDLTAFGARPRGIKVSPDGRGYVVTMENANSFIWLDVSFKFIRSVPTEVGPYGVAFDPRGRYIWVAASRAGQLQVFDAKTSALVASVPVGKRCWHFSFTPNGQQLLLACGRSNAVMVIDTASYRVVSTLDDFKMPWGVVTYPPSSGSLDTSARAAP